MSTLITGYRGWIGGKLFKEMGGLGLDVREGDNVISCTLPEVDVVFHLAAQSSVEASWRDPVHDSDNLKMVVRLVHAYPQAKIIYTNSAASLDRSSPYGFSKWACAEYLKQFHKNYVICTLPNVYGEGSRSVVDIFKERDTVTIYGSGKHTRDYVHVDDIVKGLIKAKDWEKGEYQLGSGKATSVLQLAEGKEVLFSDARKESKDSTLKNTTPNWEPEIDLFDYMKL